ncbi:MAG TPA: glycosyltransferase, partial [Chloroflexota bacterium]|nr:glycosyltransferase [Chloroflexota bacterium]
MPDRILYFTDGAAFGGAEEVLLSLLGGLDRSRWEPRLVHHREPAMAPLVDEAQRLNVQRHEVPRTYGAQSGSRWRHLADLVRYIRTEQPTVFHAHLTWPLACKYGLLAAILARVPVIVATSHCYVDVGWRDGVLLQRAIATRVHRFIGVSASVGDGLSRTLRIPNRKMRVVHNGIAVERFKSASASGLRKTLTHDTERPVILCVARLDSGKGHRFLLRAAVHVPDAMFVFAGAGPQLNVLQTEARSLGLEDRTLFLGHRSDVPELLASCDIFVLPSLNEGLPLSVLEAMAASRP